jgi:hypothetical protein
LNEIKKWFKDRKPYAKLLAEKRDVNVAMLQDLARIFPLIDSKETREYLRTIYLDILAYSIVANKHPNFAELPKKDQDYIIKETQKTAEERAKEHEDIW